MILLDNLLVPDIGLVFWMIIVFGLLVFVLGKFAWRPIMKALRKREQNIEEALMIAEKTKEEMVQLQFDNKVLLKEAKAERDEMLKEAKILKETIIEEAKAKASEESGRIIAAAKERIHFEKMAVLTDLKNQMAQISIEIAEKILARELSDSEVQKEIINKELQKVTV